MIELFLQFINNIFLFSMNSKSTSRTNVLHNYQNQSQPDLKTNDNLQRIYQKSFFKRITTSKKASTLLTLKKQWVFRAFINQMLTLAPLVYKKQFNVQQQWEKQEEIDENLQDETEQIKYLFNYTQRPYMIMQSFLLVYCCIYMLMLSVKQIYNIEHIDSSFGIIWIFFIIIDCIVNINTIKQVKNKHISDRLKILKIFLWKQFPFQLICLVTATSTLFEQTQSVTSIILTLICIGCLLVKIQKKMFYFKELIIDMELNQHFKIVQLIFFLFFMGHCFGLLMYSSSFYKKQQNWLTRYQINDKPWWSKYIYSLYWAITTMVTVGYGDIVPTNEVQVIVAMFVQLLGTAIFGYMISVIGITLNDMKKRQQKLQQQLSIVSRLSKFFDLSKDLTFRLRKYIQNNQKVDSSYSIQDEKKIRQQLNSQLNNEIIKETNEKVVKKSIFFLTYFTRNFQNQIALKLIKKIYQPNEYIEEHKSNNASMFIIQRGIVQIYARKKQKNKNLYKLLRTIKEEKDSNVNLNVYAFTKMIANKQINLVAKSKVFTIAYELKKKDFMEVLQLNPLDYQTFCQIRDSIMEKRIPQSIECPNIIKPKYHFVSNRYMLIKKFNYSQKQSRKQVFRSKNKIKTLQKMVTDENSYDPNDSYEQINIQPHPPRNSILSNSNKILKNLSARKSQRFSISHQKSLLEQHEQVQTKYVFEIFKNFDKYSLQSNISKVLLKYEKLKKKNQKRKHNNKNNNNKCTEEQSLINFTQL